MPVDFELYEEVSGKIFAAAREFSNTVEVASIDECFLDFSVFDRSDRKLLLELGKTLQQKIDADIGVPVSIGIAETKTLAKMASDAGKPHGVLAVMPEDREKFLQSLPIQSVPGIGKKQTPKMHFRNILTPHDYTMIDLPTIRTLFHRPGAELWWELCGTQMFPVRSGRPSPKSIQRTRSFEDPTMDMQQVWNSYVVHTQRIIKSLEEEGLMAKRILLYFREKTFETHWFETVLHQHTLSYSTVI